MKQLDVDVSPPANITSPILVGYLRVLRALGCICRLTIGLLLTKLDFDTKIPILVAAGLLGAKKT